MVCCCCFLLVVVFWMTLGSAFVGLTFLTDLQIESIRPLEIQTPLRLPSPQALADWNEKNQNTHTTTADSMLTIERVFKTQLHPFAEYYKISFRSHANSDGDSDNVPFAFEAFCSELFSLSEIAHTHDHDICFVDGGICRFGNLRLLDHDNSETTTVDAHKDNTTTDTEATIHKVLFPFASHMVLNGRRYNCLRAENAKSILSNARSMPGESFAAKITALRKLELEKMDMKSLLTGKATSSGNSGGVAADAIVDAPKAMASPEAVVQSHDTVEMANDDPLIDATSASAETTVEDVESAAPDSPRPELMRDDDNVTETAAAENINIAQTSATMDSIEDERPDTTGPPQRPSILSIDSPRSKSTRREVAAAANKPTTHEPFQVPKFDFNKRPKGLRRSSKGPTVAQPGDVDKQLVVHIGQSTKLQWIGFTNEPVGIFTTQMCFSLKLPDVIEFDIVCQLTPWYKSFARSPDLSLICFRHYTPECVFNFKRQYDEADMQALLPFVSQTVVDGLEHMCLTVVNLVEGENAAAQGELRPVESSAAADATATTPTPSDLNDGSNGEEAATAADDVIEVLFSAADEHDIDTAQDYDDRSSQVEGETTDGDDAAIAQDDELGDGSGSVADATAKDEPALSNYGMGNHNESEQDPVWEIHGSTQADDGMPAPTPAKETKTIPSKNAYVAEQAPTMSPHGADSRAEDKETLELRRLWDNAQAQSTQQNTASAADEGEEVHYQAHIEGQIIAYLEAYQTGIFIMAAVALALLWTDAKKDAPSAGRRGRAKVATAGKRKVVRR